MWRHCNVYKRALFCVSLQLTWLPQEVESSDFILVTNLRHYNNAKRTQKSKVKCHFYEASGKLQWFTATIDC